MREAADGSEAGHVDPPGPVQTGGDRTLRPRRIDPSSLAVREAGGAESAVLRGISFGVAHHLIAGDLRSGQRSPSNVMDMSDDQSREADAEQVALSTLRTSGFRKSGWEPLELMLNIGAREQLISSARNSEDSDLRRSVHRRSMRSTVCGRTGPRRYSVRRRRAQIQRAPTQLREERGGRQYAAGRGSRSRMDQAGQGIRDGPSPPTMLNDEGVRNCISLRAIKSPCSDRPLGPIPGPVTAPYRPPPTAAHR